MPSRPARTEPEPHDAGDTPRSLRALRSAVDALDRALLRALAHRTVVVDAIAQLKRARGLPVRDPEREASLLEDRARYGASLGLDPAYVRALFEGVLAASRARQEAQRGGEVTEESAAPAGVRGEPDEGRG